MADDGMIKTYQGSDIGVSQCLVTLEGFVGDMDNAELADDSTVDTSDAVIAINGLIWSLEQREVEIERLEFRFKRECYLTVDLRAEVEKLRAALATIRAFVGTSSEAYHVARAALGDQ